MFNFLYEIAKKVIQAGIAKPYAKVAEHQIKQELIRCFGASAVDKSSFTPIDPEWLANKFLEIAKENKDVKQKNKEAKSQWVKKCLAFRIDKMQKAGYKLQANPNLNLSI